MSHLTRLVCVTKLHLCLLQSECVRSGCRGRNESTCVMNSRGDRARVAVFLLPTSIGGV